MSLLLAAKENKASGQNAIKFSYKNLVNFHFFIKDNFILSKMITVLTVSEFDYFLYTNPFLTYSMKTLCVCFNQPTLNQPKCGYTMGSSAIFHRFGLTN